MAATARTTSGTTRRTPAAKPRAAAKSPAAKPRTTTSARPAAKKTSAARPKPRAAKSPVKGRAARPVTTARRPAAAARRRSAAIRPAPRARLNVTLPRFPTPTLRRLSGMFSGWLPWLIVPVLLLALWWGRDLLLPPSKLAPLFTPEVDFWGGRITRWAQEYRLDPNLLATVMQIESCGYPNAVSPAGAQGLFQVMPLHFATGDDMLNPNTNAARAASFLDECMGYAGGDPALALACYNGGPSVLQRHYDTWAAETQRYYWYGRGIYADALQNSASSDTLTQWLNAGGINLCRQAASALGIVRN